MKKILKRVGIILIVVIAIFIFSGIGSARGSGRESALRMEPLKVNPIAKAVKLNFMISFHLLR